MADETKKITDLSDWLHRDKSIPRAALQDIVCHEYTDPFGYEIKHICALNASLIRLSGDLDGFFRFMDNCPTGYGRVHVVCVIPPECHDIPKEISKDRAK